MLLSRDLCDALESCGIKVCFSEWTARDFSNAASALAAAALVFAIHVSSCAASRKNWRLHGGQKIVVEG